MPCPVLTSLLLPTVASCHHKALPASSATFHSSSDTRSLLPSPRRSLLNISLPRAPLGKPLEALLIVLATLQFLAHILALSGYCCSNNRLHSLQSFARSHHLRRLLQSAPSACPGIAPSGRQLTPHFTACRMIVFPDRLDAHHLRSRPQGSILATPQYRQEISLIQLVQLSRRTSSTNTKSPTTAPDSIIQNLHSLRSFTTQ